MSDIDVANTEAQASDQSIVSSPEPTAAVSGASGLVDPLTDSLADSAGDADGSVQFFANGIPDASENPRLSLRAVKQDIEYLSAQDQASCLDAVIGMPLARFRYREGDPEAPQRLGFMIDDMPTDSPAVASDGRHVDVYGFTSMAVAALQVQQREIATLRAQVEALQARLERLGG